jgi:hypothetical protein
MISYLQVYEIETRRATLPDLDRGDTFIANIVIFEHFDIYSVIGTTT